jgi:biopolymer transport protein ExbB
MTTVEAIKDLLVQTGVAWILWLLAVLSVSSMALIVERYLFFRKRSGNLPELATRLGAVLETGDFNTAILELEASPAIAAQIAASGLRLANKGPQAVEKAMQSAEALERSRLEKNLAFLGTLGNNAPFIGLFGTVVGIVGAFEELGHSSGGHTAAAQQAASQAVMSSIAEALVATAVGLFVALPAVAAYNYFQRQIAALVNGSEVLSNLVLAYLTDQEK